MSARGFLPEGTNPGDVFINILQSDAYAQLFISFLILGAVSMTMSTIDTNTYIFS